MNASLELRRAIKGVGFRYQRLHLWYGLTVCWLAVAAVAVSQLPSRGLASPSVVYRLAAVAAVAGAVWYLVARRAARDPRWVARRIEAKHPDLSAALLAAVEQGSPKHGRLGYLQAAVVETALAHGRSHDWGDVVPAGRLTAARLAHAAALALLVSTLAVLDFRKLAQAGAGDPSFASAVMAGGGTTVQVEPGNAEIERGTPLLVIAKFPGAVPPEAVLAVEGSPARLMARNLDDPTFAGHVPAVDADLSYRVDFPGGHSDTYRVKVYEHPEMKRANAKLTFPAYTGQIPKAVEDVRHVTTVEGTEVTLDCHLNKAVASAVLADEKGNAKPLIPVDAEKHVYRVALTATETQRYKLKLTDADGRANKLPADIAVNVTKNLPPVVTVPRPGRDSRVSPLEELPLKAEMKDDFGLVRYGLSVVPAGQEAKEVVLHDAGPGPKRAQPDHLLDFEALKSQPDQVVSYFFWAEDVGPDGQRRRSNGDLYFAEVRHFEEIFRQGEPQSGEQQQQQQQEGQQGNAQQAEELAELQKQIVNATWKLIRRETGATPTEKFAEDVKLVRESQHAVIEKAGELAEKLTAPASVENLKQATKFMADAEQKLDGAAVKTLPAALAAEQAAYQALMKLRAREFDVTRGNRQQRNARSQANNSRSPSQQQLRQLDLANEENRYETQSAARAEQERQAQRDREQRENRELADRLKELARRQTDLTDRVKEFQSAMEQAKDEAKKEELRQQLKRLRDQQQEVMRDTDELQERMERPENQERTADARQQAEEARENARQAAEALEQGRLADAVNAGTRAGRQLDQLRDQLRKQTADQFGEEMRELRQQARQLDEDQQKLTKQLDEMNKPAKPGLRDAGAKDEVQKGLQEQKQKLDAVTERVQKTVGEAEKSEPALAQGLYDAARKAAENRVGETMDAARRLADAGILPDAAEAARRAGQGTEELRKGVEKAADGVLGGQTEELKLARRELDELAERVDREIAQATGQQAARRPGRDGEAQTGQQPGQQSQPGPQGQAGGQGQEPGREQGQQPGQQPGQGDQGRRPGQQGQQPGQGQPGEGRQPGDNPQSQPGRGEGRGEQPRLANQGRRGLADRPGQDRQAGGVGFDRGGERGPGGPFREDGFREWNDRMRATEDLLDDPQLRAEAARIRDRVRAAREEFKRHAKEPDWKQLQDMVQKPLTELRDRVAEEVRRRESPDALVPIDRDPVPPRFTDGVRKYYERLGGDR
jgi:hypothetical protein